MTNAIAELYQSYRSELCNYLKRKFGAGRSEAEDVVHQAFARLAARHEPALVENPRAYLYRASHHILIDERRRLSSWRRGVVPALAGSGVAADEITPERVSIAQERLEILDRVLQRLPRARRRSLLSNRLDGLSCAEIARRDGYSESAVKKHITQAMAELDAALVSAEPPKQRSTRTKTIAASLVAFLVAAATYVGMRPSVYTEHYATDIAQLREVALPDGSRVTLGARTSIDIRIDGERRQVVLNEGEAFFSVTRDVERPFYVSVGSNVVRVVGTQFDVRRGAAEIQVDVLEGVVEVARKPGASALAPTDTRTLKAGQGVSGTLDGELGETRETGAAAAGAWRSGRRAYVDVPLREIVADINRYSRQTIEIAAPIIGELRLSATFRSSEPQQILGSLELTMPLRVEREGSGRIVLREKPEESAVRKN